MGKTKPTEKKKPEVAHDKETKEILSVLRDYNFDPSQATTLMEALRTPFGARDVIKHYLEPDKSGIIRVGLISDTHMGHRDSDLSVLHTAYDQFKKAGVQAVYHAGDILEGVVDPRVTHPNERFVHSLDDQVAFLKENYPRTKKFKTYFLEGKHTQSFYRKKKAVIGKVDEAINAARPDLIPIGIYEADVKLTPKLSMRLTYNDALATYAVSYYPQKEVLSLMGGTKPDILVVGGTHYLYNIPDYRDVNLFMAGSTQRQTSYMRRKKRPSMMGAWILELEIDSDKSLKENKTTVLPFY